MKDCCLICHKSILKFYLWNNYRINECSYCNFLFIKYQLKKKVTNFPTGDVFYNGTRNNDKKREDLFANIISKKRILYYQKFLKRKIVNILEVGCGTAALSKGFLNNDIHYTGIENNSSIFNFGKKKNRNIIYGDFLKKKFKKKYDIIFASQVLEHIVDPNVFVAKCKKLLKKNGIVHLDTPNNSSWVSICRKFLPGKKHFGALEPLDHMRAYSSKSLKNLFLNHDLKPILIDSFRNDHRTFGQLTNKISIHKKIFFFFQNIFNRNSLLVGVAHK
jgi:2-polyprenyl-3-methyl-5-hydroxy-6-metoxy-1,4-benzoquinol methylase